MNRIATSITGIRAVEARERKRAKERVVWENWLRGAADVASMYGNHLPEDDPFAYGEAASVSILTAAAARAGYVGSSRVRNQKSARPRPWRFLAKSGKVLGF